MIIEDRNEAGHRWQIRRRIIITTLILCASTILYIMIAGEDTRVNESIVLGSFSLAGAVISTYCFAATWDDRTQRVLTNQRAGNSVIAPGSVVFQNERTPTERKQKAEERLTRLRARGHGTDQGIDNPDA